MDLQQQQSKQQRHVSASLLRRIAGWTLFCLGLIGLVLPVLQGFLLLALGIVLLGPKDPALRRFAFYTRAALRRWSQVKQPYLRRSGQKVRHMYSVARLQFRAQLRRYQQEKNKRHARLLIFAFGLGMLAMAAGLTFLVWHQVS